MAETVQKKVDGVRAVELYYRVIREISTGMPAFFHTQVSYYIDRSDRADGAVRSIIGFVQDMDAAAIADGVRSSHQAEVLHSFTCNYCAGSLAGKYMQERYVRRKETD